MQRQQLPHPRHRELGLLEQAGRVGEAEGLGEVQQRARALLAADHREVRLVAVQPGEEDDAGLVEARRRLEDVARQRHRRREDRVEARPGRRAASAAERGARRRRDRVEDAEQRVAVPVVLRAADAVAGDQLGVVEVVAGVHAHAFGQAPAHRDLLVLVEQRDLDAVDLARVGGDDAERRLHRRGRRRALPQ